MVCSQCWSLVSSSFSIWCRTARRCCSIFPPAFTLTIIPDPPIDSSVYQQSMILTQRYQRESPEHRSPLDPPCSSWVSADLNRPTTAWFLLMKKMNGPVGLHISTCTHSYTRICLFLTVTSKHVSKRKVFSIYSLLALIFIQICWRIKVQSCIVNYTGDVAKPCKCNAINIVTVA